MLNRRHNTHLPRCGQRGMSIVELMVGIAIGLIIVAAASLLMAGQLVENRRLLTEAQVQQDIRATADFISREMRRAEATAEASALATIWYPGTTLVSGNPYANSLAANTNSIEYKYYPIALASNFLYKFELNSDSAITFAAGATQTMTDVNVMTTTSFSPSVLPDASAQIVLPCPKPCSDGTSDCWPKFHVRKAQFTLEAKAKADENVKRAVSSSVRVRNDRVEFAGSEICPA